MSLLATMSNRMTTKRYRIIYESYDQKKPTTTISRVEVLNGELNEPSNCLDFSIGLDNQIALIQGVQDIVLQEKIQLIHKLTKVTGSVI